MLTTNLPLFILDIPALQKHRFPLFIDDAEPAAHLAIRMQAPNLVSIEPYRNLI